MINLKEKKNKHKKRQKQQKPKKKKKNLTENTMKFHSFYIMLE